MPAARGPRAARRALFGVSSLAAVTLLAGACGGSGPPVAQPDTTPSLSGTNTIVSAEPSQYGTILVDGLGRTLYMFAGDQAGRSTCYGRCAEVWKPFIAEGHPQPDGSLNATVEEQIRTITRKDGGVQVTYYRHPLYYYAGDSNDPGRVTGQGVEQFGGTWYVLSPTGSRVAVSQ